MSKKYPRTYHLPFSPEVHSDDKTIYKLDNFINQRVIITEKLDGGNTCLKNGQVFARTHSSPTKHPSFNVIKNMYYSKMHLIPNDIEIFGENMFAIHSIEYTNLTSYFYMFAILKDGLWLSFDEVIRKSYKFDLPTVPVIFDGIFKSKKDIQSFMDSEIKKSSVLGGEREGFVIRVANSFKDEEFSTHMAKYVRQGHVQTDKHWNVNWKQATIND